MPDRVTLDVIDRPAEGVRRSFGRVRALRSAGAPGLRAVFALGTAHFSPRVRPAPTPRRVAVLAAWEDSAAWVDTLGELCAGGREHWHLEGEVVRATFSEAWKGWTPDVTDAAPL